MGQSNVEEVNLEHASANKIKYIILAFLVINIIVISVTYYFGNRENIQSTIDFKSYLNATQLISNNQGNQAIEPLKVLIEKYPENPSVTRLLGLAYFSSENFKLASYYYSESLKLKPTFQLDAHFMVQYGNILYYNGEYNKAKFILKRSLKLDGVYPYKEIIDSLFEKIVLKEKRKG